MVNGKINVLHLLLSLETGGMERFVYEHCLEIDKSKFNVSVCCIDRLGGFFESLVKNDINVDIVQKNQNHFDYLFPLKLSRYLRNKKIHVLHIHSGAFFHGSVAGFLSRTPVIIYTEHGRHLVEPKIIFLFDKISCFFSDKIITVSHELEKYLIENIKLPAKKVETVINGVNTESFRPRCKSQRLLSELCLAPDIKIIGAVGRLAFIKDHFTLIKAFKIVEKKIPEAKLVLVGEGPCEKDLKILVEKLALSSSVVFAGNRSDIPDILNLFDVFVLPSLSEGTSLSLLEAMASGLPSVVTSVGGNPNLIKENINGYLVETKNTEQLAKRIEDILSNSEISKAFGIASRKLVISRYSLKANIKIYEDIYKNLLNS
jgi:sugar transferase (PEP-CTERM/EpsH1 system associated)